MYQPISWYTTKSFTMLVGKGYCHVDFPDGLRRHFIQRFMFNSIQRHIWIMDSRSSIIARITGFLGEEYAAIPVLKTHLETVIAFSSAFAEMYSFTETNQKTRMHCAKMIEEASDSTRLRADLELEKSALKTERDAWNAGQLNLRTIKHSHPLLN